MLGKFCQAKIQHLHDPITTKHDVLWFDIAMDDARLMSSDESRSGLNRHIENLINLHFVASQASSQRLTVNELQGDEMTCISFVDLVDGDDVWVIQCGSSLRFLHEALHAVSLRGKFLGQDLQRDFSMQFCIVRKIDLTHSTGAKLGHDAVV